MQLVKLKDQCFKIFRLVALKPNRNTQQLHVILQHISLFENAQEFSFISYHRITGLWAIGIFNFT